MTKLEKIKHARAYIYEWYFLGTCVRGSDSDIPTTLKLHGNACSANIGHKISMKMAKQAKFVWRDDYLEWI